MYAYICIFFLTEGNYFHVTILKNSLIEPLEFPCTFVFRATLYECKIEHHTASFGPWPGRGWEIIPLFTDIFIHLECICLDKKDVSTSEKLMSSKRKAPLGTCLFS